MALMTVCTRIRVCASEKRQTRREAGTKPRVSCEKGDGRAAERRSADTNLKSLIRATQPKTVEKNARFAVSSTPNKRIYLRG